MQWIVAPFRRCFDYSGRSRRMEYWSFALFTFILLSAVGALEKLLRLPVTDQDDPIRGFLFLGLAIPGLAVSVRRLHDTNRAGWWTILPVAPFLFWMVAVVARFNSPGLFRIVMVFFILAPLALLALMCVPGTRGSNRFGADPKAQDLAETFN